MNAAEFRKAIQDYARNTGTEFTLCAQRMMYTQYLAGNPTAITLKALGINPNKRQIFNAINGRFEEVAITEPVKVKRITIAERENQILEAVKNGNYSMRDIAEVLGLARDSAAVYARRLVRRGQLIGKINNTPKAGSYITYSLPDEVTA